MRFDQTRRLPLACALGLVAVMLFAGSALAAKLPGADQGGRLLTTVLTGAAEVPGPGDPDGSGTARITLNPGQGLVCFALTAENITTATVTTTGAHIHVGTEDVAGPVVVALIAPESGFSSGCVEADRDLIEAILQNPEAYYVNVHTTEFPAGAIRGQLSK